MEIYVPFRLQRRILDSYIGKKVYLGFFIVGKATKTEAGKIFLEISETDYQGNYRVFLRKGYIELKIPNSDEP